MKRYFTIGVLILVMMFLTWGLLFAAPVTIADPDGQSQVSVLGGALRSTDRTKGTNSIVGTGLLRAGAFRAQTINIKGATAGDNIIVYDALSEPDTRVMTEIEFEMGISVNNGSVSIDAKGTPFTRGIYIKSSATTTLTSVVYDY